MSNQQYTPEMAVDLRIATDVQISPDGSRVAFCVAPIGHLSSHPASTIFIVPTDGSSQPRAITGSDHNNISPRWSPDGTQIAFLSDRVERGTSQLYVVPAEGGEPLRLTSFEGGATQPAWSSDGQLVYFTARRTALNGEKSPKSEVHVWSEMTNPRAIGCVAPQGGGARVIGPAEGHVSVYAPSPNGEMIAALITPSERLADAADSCKLVTFPVDDATTPQTLVTFMRGGDHLEWSPDSSAVVTINSRQPDHLTNHIHLVRVVDGTVTTLSDRNMTPYMAGFLGNELLSHSVAGQRSKLETLSHDGQPTGHLNDGDELANHWIMPQFTSSADGSKIALLAASPTRPPDVFVLDRNDGVRRLTDLNTQLDHVKLADMEEITWTGQDGLEIHGWFLRPTDGQEAPYALVTDVHGGPPMAWGNWFHGTWHDWAQILAANGYAVLLPNPRGSTGKGRDFTNANRADLGGQDFNDVIRGVDALIERGLVDPERTGIGGWSYGGFLTALTVVRTDRFKAAVVGAGVTNWVSKVGTTDIRPYNESNFAAPLHESPDPYWMRSPVRYFKHARTPTLVVHGEADVRVPVTQAHEYFHGLRANGVETEMVTYPRQGHAFHERAFELDLLQRIVAWFDQHLKG